MHDNLCNIAVLISGSGSNLQSIIDNIKKGNIKANIACVISNNPDAYGLMRAKQARIPTHIVEHTQFSTREEFEKELINTLKVYEVDLVILAGFMRILGSFFVSAYKDKILNIHPSLLPKLPGLHTHQRAIEAGETMHGCSVHLVTTDLDQGPLIIQATVPVKESDSPDSLAKRVLEKEHIIYPLAIKWFSQNKLKFKGGSIFLDNKRIDSPINLSSELELELKLNHNL